MNSSVSFMLKGVSGTYQAIEKKSHHDTSNLDGRASLPGLSSFKLADGRNLNKKDDGTFIIVQTGEELTRIS
jgi:hypothetical protein